jgi:hypothetical protein
MIRKVDFIRLQGMSYQEDTIVYRCEIAENLIDCHRIAGDTRLLSVLFEELVAGRGKVKWARRGLFLATFVVAETDE